MSTTKNTIVRILMAAKKLINSKSKWIKESYRRDGGTADAPVTQYCAMGAIEAAAQKILGPEANRWSYSKYPDMIKAIDMMKKELPKIPEGHCSDCTGEDEYADVEQYNDDPATTHKDIMHLFNNAITRAKMEAEIET